MNERGIVSLTGILILLMLAYLIRGTSFTAGTYVDMIRNFQVENKLQLDAQSKFDAILQNYEGKSFTDTELTEQIAADNEENGIQEHYCINYNEFIPMLIHLCQTQQKEINAIKAIVMQS